MNKKKNRSSWVKRRSELQAYTDAYFRTDVKGDYIRADVSFKDRKARLTVEDRTERRFHSAVESGCIEREWGVRSTASEAAAVMRRKSGLFSSIPDRRVIEILTPAYGIGVYKHQRIQRKKPAAAGIRILVFGVILGVFIAATVVLSLIF